MVPSSDKGGGKRPLVLVSACLVGVPCRYNGGAKTIASVAALFAEGSMIPVCPEQLGGLPTPRPPSELKEGRVFSSEGEDVTEAFRLGAEIVAGIAARCHCKIALLKAKSPSCGCGLVYDGTFSGTTIPGDGVTATLLKKKGIAVFTEDNLDAFGAALNQR